jgi:hypothetical protein
VERDEAAAERVRSAAVPRRSTRIVAVFLPPAAAPRKKTPFRARPAPRIIAAMIRSSRRLHGGSVLAATRLSLGLLLAACASSPSARPIDRDEATAVLDAQVAKWNQGDLRGFVATYWDGPELSFFGRSGLVRGRGDLLATYERAYPTPAARGVLSFEVVAFEPLEYDHALLLGRFHLERQQPADGVFSLVLARQRGQVVILHDHTTETPPASAH